MVHVYQCGHGVYVLVQGIRVAAGAGEGSEVYVVGAQEVYGHWDERARLGHLLVEYRGMVPRMFWQSG